MSAPEPSSAPVTVAGRLSTYLRGGGIVTPLITVFIAFVIGGLVVLFTGHNPLSTYRAIFEGSGLNWFFPWISSDDRTIAALNLQQTLIATTPLILTGLAVAFAFRCGLFNIGGQGQYLVGSFAAVWVGSSFSGMPGALHIVLCMIAACLAGAAWGGIAGLLRATTGANEVISTIMLNWVAIWIGVWAFGLGAPLQNNNPAQKDVPVESAPNRSADAQTPTAVLRPSSATAMPRKPYSLPRMSLVAILNCQPSTSSVPARPAKMPHSAITRM